MGPSGNGLSGNGLSGNGLSGIARADVRRSLCPFHGYSPRTLWVLPGVPYGCYPGTRGYSGYSHSPRQSRSRPWRRGRGRRATTAVRRHWPGRRRPVVHRPIVQVLPGCTRTRAHTRTHAHTHTRTRTRTRICTHTRTRTQPCLQMHIPITHIHTRTHSHTPALRAAAAVSERSACRTCAASPAHGTITARLWCLLRATNIDVYICMHAGSTGERERTLHLHVRGRPRRRRSWPPVGVRCGSKPDEVRKIASGFRAWDHFRDGTCVTASHERSRRGREPPVHPPTGLVSR
jgi:hypothetical protein